MTAMRAIAELFGKSPFGPLVEHTNKVHQTVREVRPLVEAFLDEDYEEVELIYERISKLEHKADVIKREIRNHLPKSLFLPVDRGDMLKFLKEQGFKYVKSVKGGINAWSDEIDHNVPKY